MSDTRDQDQSPASWDFTSSGDPYRALFEEAADGMFITDPRWICIAANPRAAELSGYSRAELLGMTISDLLPSEDLARDPIGMDDLRQGKIMVRERRIRRKDGSLLPVEISARMLHAGNLLGIVRDITERKRAEAGSEQRTRELDVLHKLGLQVSASLSFQQASAAALQGTLEAVQPDLAFLFLVEGERLILQEIMPPEARHRLDAIPEHRAGEYICGLAAREGKPIYSRDIHNDPCRTWEECKKAGFTSFAALPIVSGEETIGVIGLASAQERDFKAQAEFLETLVRLVSVALKNAWLYEVALKEVAERKRAEEALRESEERFQLAMEASRDGLWDWNVSTDEVYYSPSYATMLGYASSELPGHINSWTDLVHSEDKEAALKANMDCIENRRDVFDVEFRMLANDGEWRWMLARGKAVVRDCNGRAVRLVGTHTDITDRKRAEEALRNSEARLRSLIDSAPFGAHLYELDERDRLVFRGFNRSANRILGVDNAQFLGRTIEDAFPPLAATEVPARYKHVAATGEGYETEQVEYEHEKIRGAFQVHAFQAAPRWMAAFFIDITERKKAEIEKGKLQERLLQAQKMESVGRLAGGVAHDFNNLLSVILGHAELALMNMKPNEPFFDYFKEIQSAAQRSAEVTRQLLAFARKQTIAPKVLDLNATLEAMLKMLRRLIGEDIDLAWLPETGLWTIMMDPSQADQILTNLCINARDAIAGVGKVTIATRNTTFDEAYCAAHAGFSPGEYVMLAVSDSGCGMDAKILDRLFEPFFTTKGVGKGTGLGLAMVYGIVKQNDGFINVNSAVGEGTTIKIYLPRHMEMSFAKPAEGSIEPVLRGRETVLMVEDEPAILGVSRMMLETLGYRVLVASTPGEAIHLAREHAGEIHLLMTDVIMPEMDGRELAQGLLSAYPQLKRLYTSGYTADIIAHHGVLDEGIHFIQKPFSMQELAAKIREALDSK